MFGIKKIKKQIIKLQEKYNLSKTRLDFVYDKLSKITESLSNRKVNTITTVIDYGAIVYNTKEDCIEGKDSSKAFADMLNAVGTVVLPAYGWVKKEGCTFMYRPEDNIVSLGGNKGCKLLSTKAINMFCPVHERQEISGFTAYYVGKITKECAVVKIGDKLNKGGIDIRRNGEEYHHWANRTRSRGLVLDFDFVGDEKYMISRLEQSGKPKNPDFIPNGGVHAVLVDFNNKTESNQSYIYLMKIRGFWKHVNRGIKITQKNTSQTINHLDVDVKIWGSVQPININGISLSEITVFHQNQYTRDWDDKDPLYKEFDKNNYDEWNLPSYEVKGTQCYIDVFDADLNTKGNNSGTCHLQGNIEVHKLSLGGKNAINGMIPSSRGVYTNANIKKSTIV